MLRKLAFFLTLISTSIFALSQDSEKSFDYPVKRGSSEWNAIKTYDSLRKVTQIPSVSIDKMNTSALLKSIIDYPLLTDVFVFENYQKGLEKLSENFSAFATILQRTDLDVVLLNTYASYLDKTIDTTSLFKMGEYSFHTSFIEVLIGYSFQQNKIKSGSSKLYLHQLLRGYEKKKNNPDVFGRMSLSTCVWAMNSILLSDKASEKFATKDSFILRGNTFPDATITNIISQAEAFLKQVD